MTERLYYTDPYATTFTASVVEVSKDGCRIQLDRSAFYPSSGGQPHDTGAINGTPVSDVVDEGDVVVHVLAAPLHVSAGDQVTGEVDRQRRFDHMQQHTGQHLLSAAIIQLYGWETLSFHMGEDVSTIELATSSTADAQLQTIEERANQLVAENRPVTITFEDAGAVAGLRKTSARSGRLRIISIQGIDRSACGGTHVRATGEIGCVLLRKTEKVRGNIRLEFVCGLRAVWRARTDFAKLAAISAALSCGIDEAPGVVRTQAARLAEAEKSGRKLAMDLAALRGQVASSTTERLPSGALVYAGEREESPDELRAEAQGFTAAPRSAFLIWSTLNRSVLLAVSADFGLQAGNLMKAELASCGGRGGGSATLAQGSVADTEKFRALVDRLIAIVRTPK